MSLTPAQQQYHDIKQQYQDCILFFRLGDFYEVFYEDARICSKVLDLVLTARNKTAPNPIPMAGIPHHSSDKYIQKLIHHGYKVAIAEQTSEPKPGKIVSREVVSVVTPATYLSETAKTSATIAAVCMIQTTTGSYHLARGDFAIGAYMTQSYLTLEDLLRQCMILSPQELIVDIDMPDKQLIHDHMRHLGKALISTYDRPHDPESFLTTLLHVQTLQSYGSACATGRKEAISLLFHYLTYTQKGSLSMISTIRYIPTDHVLKLDETTIKNLEILTSSYDQTVQHSLYHTLDRTATKMGSRLLKDRILHPRTQSTLINERLDYISSYVDRIDHTKLVHQSLSGMLDIPRLLSLIIQRRPTASLVSKLRYVLGQACDPLMIGELQQVGCPESVIDHAQEIRTDLLTRFKADPLHDEVDYVADGVDPQIDELRVIAYHSDDLLLAYQQALITHTGISNIKVKYTNNQGYAIEITNKDIQTFEQAVVRGDEQFDLVRRQTLKGAERYMSPYLDALQQRIISARDSLIKLESAQLELIKQRCISSLSDLTVLAEMVGMVDVCSSYALLAHEYHYCRPEIANDQTQRSIIAGRHPVVEHTLGHHGQFIPNDLVFDSPTQTLGYTRPEQADSNKTPISGKGNSTSAKSDTVHIITGPNMGGKSTYLRQHALIVLMAHSGLWVPAQSVKIPLCDGVYARIGSGDNLAKQQSTFMTEMIEVANILNNATSRSFIIFDELGRGTSTYDGLALTHSIITHVATALGAKTLVATHYHELISLEQQYPGIRNYSVSVYETDRDVVFLKKIVSGGANKSYGLDVAKRAGISNEIIDHARQLLAQMENPLTDSDTSGSSCDVGPDGFITNHATQHGRTQNRTTQNGPPSGLRGQITQPSIPPHYAKIKRILDATDINQCTPMQALALLATMKE